eukprot:14557133-Alexandrium_andersonii.AAC.1
MVAVAALAALGARPGSAVLASLWRVEGDEEGRALPACDCTGAAGRGGGPRGVTGRSRLELFARC